MAELSISKRISFPKGEQARFLNDVQSKLALTGKELARLAGKDVRTVGDWKREKFLMSFDVAKLLSKISGVKIPARAEVKTAYWYASLGSSVGGRAVYKKYGSVGGSEEERKRKWRIWWDTKGKFLERSAISVTKPIKKPDFSVSLAEFTGIILGDGGISKRQVVVTLHRYDDKEYSVYVRELIKKLFGVTPGIYRDKISLADDIVISRTELVGFCVNNLGLKIGSKVRQQVDVPLWIQEKKSYRTACLRGLVDTDGCVIKHRYVVNSKKYLYKKLSFTNSSVPLVRYVLSALEELGMNPRVTKNGKEVRVDSKADMKIYFRVVGSHNPKHLNRWLN
jgi:hypothetical protein